MPGKDEGQVSFLKDLMVKGGEETAVQSGEGSECGSVPCDPERKPPVCLQDGQESVPRVWRFGARSSRVGRSPLGRGSFVCRK